MIKLGNEYKVKYFGTTTGFVTKKIKTKKGFKETYEIINKPNSQLYKAVLNILKDGRGILKVNYISYSGVKNKYTIWFDKNGREIIGNNSKEEKKYFDNLGKN